MRRFLLLDLDGTLVDSVPDLMVSLNRLMKRRELLPFTASEVAMMVGDGAAALVRKALATRGQVSEPNDLEFLLADYMAHIAEETRPYPGVLTTLDELAAAGWRFAVVTNKPEAAARRLLDALDLTPRFQAIAGGDTFSVRKPDAAHLLNTLSSMGAANTNAVMVGDHYNDIAAAAAASIPCIFAQWGYGTVKMGEAADATAASFEALPQCLLTLG